MKKYFAEMVGTMVLVLTGCGAAVMGGVGNLGISFAFGFAVLAMVYVIGPLSGCHINPAVTMGALLAGRISGKTAAGYMIFQVIGAVAGSAVLWLITSQMEIAKTGANSYADGRMLAALIAEFVFTFIFVLVVLGATSAKAPAGFAGLAIGLALVLVHIVCIPITGTSVNPARSIGPAIFAGSEAIVQLWLFILAPLCGGALAALVWRGLEPKA